MQHMTENIEVGRGWMTLHNVTCEEKSCSKRAEFGLNLIFGILTTFSGKLVLPQNSFWVNIDL